MNSGSVHARNIRRWDAGLMPTLGLPHNRARLTSLGENRMCFREQFCKIQYFTAKSQNYVGDAAALARHIKPSSSSPAPTSVSQVHAFLPSDRPTTRFPQSSAEATFLLSSPTVAAFASRRIVFPHLVRTRSPYPVLNIFGFKRCNSNKEVPQHPRLASVVSASARWARPTNTNN